MQNNFARMIIIVIGAIYVINGIIMWIWPHLWYDVVPGISMMGPFNSHFVRDIGLVYMISGGAFIIYVKPASDALWLAALWPAAHAVFHIWIWVTRGAPIDLVFWTNVFLIQTPAWAVIFAARVLRRSKQLSA
jgi:uncharacterized protein YjeT (DUF2065 family)